MTYDMKSNEGSLVKMADGASNGWSLTYASIGGLSKPSLCSQRFLHMFI